MSDALSLTILVCATAIGLAHLGVHAPEIEHRVAVSVVLAVAVPVGIVSTGAGLLLALAALGSARLRTRPVPDFLPAEWSES